MTTAEIISISSLTVFSLSLTLAIWNYAYNLRYTRVSLTERLHELWWSKDMMETREEVYALCKQAASNRSEMSALAAYYRAPLVTPDPPGRAAFAKLVGFFCNIEVCLDSKVIDERITCDLFAEAHYADYHPLIAAVREATLEPSRKTGRLPKWLSMTVQLERRFARHGINFPVPHQCKNSFLE
jgi:hypothetical protein